MLCLLWQCCCALCLLAVAGLRLAVAEGEAVVAVEVCYLYKDRFRGWTRS